MPQCHYCSQKPAVLKRPKTGDTICKECFLSQFELEVHETIVSNALFRRGERVAIAASGGKDSTVLAHVLTRLNRQYDYGLDLFLLSIDEGIAGYRDDSLDSVKRNQSDYAIPLLIVGYKELYGWSMDDIVRAIGLKSNCTFCGVFRRQALDRGAALLKADKLVTGHNCDDMAETVLMNLLRGDIARLQRCTHITTGSTKSHAAAPAVTDAAAPAAPAAPAASTSGDAVPDAAALLASADSFRTLPRCKPFKYAYEKEIVLYAYHRALDYFSTECIYSPNAYRGFARELLKEMEKARPRAIVDIVRSGEHFLERQDAMEAGAIGAAQAASSEGAVAAPAVSSEQQQAAGAAPPVRMTARAARRGPRPVKKNAPAADAAAASASPAAPAKAGSRGLGVCERCGYISSNALCKACVLLEGLNRSRPRVTVQHDEPEEFPQQNCSPDAPVASVDVDADSIAASSRASRAPVGLFISDGAHADDMAARVATVQTQAPSKSAGPSAAAAARAAESATSARALHAAAVAPAAAPVSAALHMAQQRNATDW